MTALTIGSIVLLHHTASGTYLDTYGWVANSPAFWNVAGSERLFVSTYAGTDRGGGTTSWQIVSADGKAAGASLCAGDRIHLRNMYPDAGYLDCCGWVEDLEPYRDQPFAQGDTPAVRCGVFTTGAPNRDNGTGIWLIQCTGQATGVAMSEHDSIMLVNAYPADNLPTDSAHASTGALVAYGDVASISAFSQFTERRRLVFTSTNASIQADHGGWKMLPSPAFARVAADATWFDLTRPETLKGRTRSMQSISNLTRFLLVDALRAISGVDVDAPDATTRTDGASTPHTGQKEREQQLVARLLNARTPSEKNDPALVDYDFQVKQLWNLLAVQHLLHQFDTSTLQVHLQQVLDHSKKQNELPPLDLIRDCFRAIAHDHELLQRATMQRRWNDALGTVSQSSLAGELVVTDKLAMSALRPFQHLLADIAADPAVITYLSEETHIQRLPYTNQCLLIGITYDRVSPVDTIDTDWPDSTPADAASLTEARFASFELLALPHEIGHYVYQHGTIGGMPVAQISQQFRTKPYFWWCEELFADVYGCIIAGPLSAFSMQAFLESGDRQRAWNEDEEHPTPHLRPYILSDILRVLGALDQRYACPGVPELLDAAWTARLERWGAVRVDPGTGRPVRLYLPDTSSMQREHLVNVERVLQHVRPIIRAFAAALLASLADRGGSAAYAIPWNSASPSSAAMPTVQYYAREMALLTGPATARAAILPAVLYAPAPTIGAATSDQTTQADTLVRGYLDIWREHGPLASGGGTHR